MRYPQPTFLDAHTPDSTTGPVRSARRLSIALWFVQGLVALMFLMAGTMKLVMPVEMMASPMALPGWFLRFIGVAEVLGAIGLVVPGATRIRPGLTPLAASGLVIIMVGAVVVTLLGGGGAQALGPAIFGSVLVAIVYGRTRLLPIAPGIAAPLAALRRRSHTKAVTASA